MTLSTLILIISVAGPVRAAGGYNTGGTGMSEGQHDSSNPENQGKLLISEEQRRLIQRNRNRKDLPVAAKNALDTILKAPNESAFQREESKGEVSYQRPSGWDGRTKNTSPPNSASGQAAGGTTASSTKNKTLRERHEQSREKIKKSQTLQNLNKPMSELEAGSRGAVSRPRTAGGSSEIYTSLRENSLISIPPERAIPFQASEQRARKRIHMGDHENAYSEIARSQIGQGKFQEARESAEKALSENPKDADAHALRAIASEALGDEAAKLASLEKAAELNPKRFDTLLAQVRKGMTLFDPSAEDSWHLLEALSHDEKPPESFSGKDIALTILALLVFGVPLTAGMTLYKRLSPEQQRRAVSWWRATSKGQILPNITAHSAAHVRKPDGASIVALEPGLRIADKYKLIRRLGVDGTVGVWKALDCVLDRPVLLKRLYESRSESGEWGQRLADAKKAAGLHHPNIADLYEILDMPIGLFVVYEYPSGKTLREVINSVGPIPLLQAIDILIPICRALQHAHHRDIVHGGISPERIVLTRQGYIKVTDFILARTTASGGEAYVAPEAKRGDPSLTSDIYSLGACLHEMLTGATPGLDGEVEPDPRAEELLGRALDLDGRTRIQNAHAFQKEMDSLRANLIQEVPKKTASDQDDGSRNETTA